MFKQILNKIKSIIQENYKFFISLAVIFLLCTIKLPYYIELPGGIIDINERFEIENAHEKDGSLNLAYVGELNATIPTYLLAKVRGDWNLVKKEDLDRQESDKDIYYRDKLMLHEANNNAIKYAYKKANKEYEIISNKLYITYVDSKANTDLNVQDEIISVNGKIFSNKEELNSYIKTFDENKKIEFLVINDKKEYTRYAYVQEYEGVKAIGIYINALEEIQTNPKITFDFKKSESGASGGLMMSLAIYNALVEDDITKGRTIVGTGTIDENGNVGEIDGVKHKLKAAVKEGADIFFVPNGDNYNDALKEQKENKYDIEIVKVETFDDALNYLINN